MPRPPLLPAVGTMARVEAARSQHSFHESHRPSPPERSQGKDLASGSGRIHSALMNRSHDRGAPRPVTLASALPRFLQVPHQPPPSPLRLHGSPPDLTGPQHLVLGGPHPTPTPSWKPSSPHPDSLSGMRSLPPWEVSPHPAGFPHLEPGCPAMGTPSSRHERHWCTDLPVSLPPTCLLTRLCYGCFVTLPLRLTSPLPCFYVCPSPSFEWKRRY